MASSNRAAHDTGLGALCIADRAGLMDGLAGEAEIINRRSIVPIWNIANSVTATPLNRAPLLRRVVFVGKAALGVRLWRFPSWNGRLPNATRTCAARS